MPKHSLLRLTTIAACVALLVAVVGASSAAAQSNNSQQASISKKQKAKRGPRGKRGKTGKTGATGPAGAAGPAGPSTAYGVFHDDTIELGTHTSLTPLTVATLGSLPAGSYAIQAKLVADSESATEDYTKCTLSAEGDSDYADDYLGHAVAGDSFRAIFAMQLLHTFSGGGSVSIQCYHSNSGDLAFVKEIKITAIKLGSIAANNGV